MIQMAAEFLRVSNLYEEIPDDDTCSDTNTDNSDIETESE